MVSDQWGERFTPAGHWLGRCTDIKGGSGLGEVGNLTTKTEDYLTERLDGR